MFVELDELIQKTRSERPRSAASLIYPVLCVVSFQPLLMMFSTFVVSAAQVNDNTVQGLFGESSELPLMYLACMQLHVRCTRSRSSLIPHPKPPHLPKRVCM